MKDPKVDKFLDFIAKDIEQRPEAIKPISQDLMARIDSLIKPTKKKRRKTKKIS